MAGKFADLEQKAKKTIEHFKVEAGRLRTGRASPQLLEGVKVDYYGSLVPLIQVGMINVPEPRCVTVQVYDPSAAEAVEKAIRQADLGLNPMRDGGIIRVNIPSLTEERRKDLVKKLHKMAEETKITVRTQRRDAVELLKKQEKNKEIAADDSRRGQEEIQKITDKMTTEIDAVSVAKEKEIMEV